MLFLSQQIDPLETEEQTEAYTSDVETSPSSSKPNEYKREREGADVKKRGAKIKLTDMKDKRTRNKSFGLATLLLFSQTKQASPFFH